MNDSMLKHIRLNDPVFAPRQETNWKTTIPSCIRRCEETGRLKAFKLQWKEGDPDKPHIYWDSDVAKVLEGMAASLLIHPDPEMEKKLDELVDLVIGAQQPDGYLNTHFTVTDQDKRWTNLHDWHELYCAGHLMEAAVAHYQATGKRKFLDAMCRYTDYIDTLFGREAGKKRGYPGHEEIELALVKLYHASGEKRYLELARYFVEERGSEPNYFVTEEKFPPAELKNRQAHKPVREQTEADGHAVRAVYLFAGLADIAGETSDPALLECAERLFRNIVQRRMYITGGIGSSQFGETFTHDFDLPNALAYAESCAAIGLALFVKRLLDITGKREYADVLERVLYNNGLSGIGLQGDTFFYANPLEMNETFFERGHIYSARQKWFDCSCCPTNYSRFLPRLGLFCADAAPDKLRIDIPAAMEISRPEYAVEVSGKYPYDGRIGIKIKKGGEFTLSVRIPSWCRKHEILLNGKSANASAGGYWISKRVWQAGDEVTMILKMVPEVVYADSRVPADIGKAAIQRGPVIYCLESVDNPGILLHSARIQAHPEFTLKAADGLPEGTDALLFRGEAVKPSDGPLYGTNPPAYEAVELCAIPFALWQNRGKSSMQIFLQVKE